LVITATSKFLALHQVEQPENGLMSTGIATVWPLTTSVSAKNLKITGKQS
jgi:hypothetical protein